MLGLLKRSLCYIPVYALLFSPDAFGEESTVTDLRGYWKSESGVEVFIPLMRDGRMPIVLMKGKPTVLLGDWDWATQSLKVNDTRFSMMDDALVVNNRRTTQTHTLKRSIIEQPSDGVWFIEGLGEFIISHDGKRDWMIHIPPSQQATIQKVKWSVRDQQMRFKLDGRCFVDFTYEPDFPDLAWVVCQEKEQDWIRIYPSTPFQTIDWSGTWTSLEGWKFNIDMSGQAFGRVYLVSNEQLIDFQASWMGASQGTKVSLSRPKGSDASLELDPNQPNQLLLRLDGIDYSFSR